MLSLVSIASPCGIIALIKKRHLLISRLMGSPYASVPGSGNQARRHVIGWYKVEIFVSVAMYRAQ